MSNRPIHPDFNHYLEYKEAPLIELYKDLREFLLELYPESNELLYHTHALTSVYTLSEKLSDGFCMVPIYTEHLNLGFHKGTLLEDPHNLLQGTGKLIRHIPVQSKNDYRNPKVIHLVEGAIAYAINAMKKETKTKGQTISKINIRE